MNSLLEISGNDIALLRDDDLRELIGLLCEADCRVNGLSPNGVRWGGHQDAPDGGLDVIVDNEANLPNSFIPRRMTGFQIKKPDMNASAIKAEMQTKGVLKDAIKTLIKVKGSYIIVCSSSSTTERALQDRLNAMKQVVSSENNHENIHLDFYDRGRVATWVRTHPSIMLWVRKRIGRNLKGWQPYENWAQPGELQGEYLIDAGLRLTDGTTKAENKETSVEEGLNKIRSLLSMPGSCIRLAGLSGVGKTRFVQAIFDNKIGENALNPFLVFYTDMSNGPEPDPRSFAEQLIAQKQHATLVVDNCPPELHRKLTEVCKGGKNILSLITIEYDVRDDLPEETRVFRLKPASDELILKLVKKRFSYISEVDARTIAGFSGGNSRIAIALANTIEQGETLSGFKDEELFERLFQQRNIADPQLIKTAQAVSLVYSFEGEDIGVQSELSVLASIANKSIESIYSDIAELKARDLIQSRSVWRALLPHAIANRLAKRALATIPYKIIDSKILDSGSERLVKSFTRRLNYLHDCDAAIKIAEDWLAKGGFIGDVSDLSSFGIDILENIAPVSPTKALEAIERAISVEKFTSRHNPHHNKFVRLLRSIAFDKILFVRSVKIICQFALNENVEDNNNSSRDILKSLFLLYLSGTHAPAEMRYSIIDELISSTDLAKQDLGLLLLDSALEAWNFKAISIFEFGARPRDYGYAPKTRSQVVCWYDFFINKSVDLILSNKNYSFKVKKVLAKNFRALWTRGAMYNELENATYKIISMSSWNEVWAEINKTIRFDLKSIDPNIAKQLINLKEIVKPSSLLEKIKIYALTNGRETFGITLELEEEGISPTESLQRIEEITVNLGFELSQNSEIFENLLPELVSGEGARLRSLGRGLAKEQSNKNKTWKQLRDQLQKIEESKRNIDLLLGFLFEAAQTDLEFTNYILDEALTDPLLKFWFPNLQAAAKIDSAGLHRLHKALDNDLSPIESYYTLGVGASHSTLNDDELSELLLKILSKQNGDEIALHILTMRFHGVDKEKHQHALISVGQSILENYNYSSDRRRQDMLEYNLSRVAEVSLKDYNASNSAIVICEKLALAIESFYIHSTDYLEFLSIIAALQPIVFLDKFIEAGFSKGYIRDSLFSPSYSLRDAPLSNIPDDIIINWCDGKPETRYSIVTGLIEHLSSEPNSAQLKWRPIVNTLLEKAPLKEEVLNKLSSSIWPNSWDGNYSDTLQSRVPLLESFLEHSDSEISSWAKIALMNLQESILKERENETALSHSQNESFE